MGDPSRPPAGLTPEQQADWDAYAAASTRLRDLQTEVSRLGQGATRAAEAGLGEPTGRAPEGVPRQGRGTYVTPVERASLASSRRTGSGIMAPVGLWNVGIT